MLIVISVFVILISLEYYFTVCWPTATSPLLFSRSLYCTFRDSLVGCASIYLPYKAAYPSIEPGGGVGKSGNDFPRSEAHSEEIFWKKQAAIALWLSDCFDERGQSSTLYIIYHCEVPISDIKTIVMPE